MNTQDYLLDKFHELVALKYQIYNALFLTLPFDNLIKLGVELSVFADFCTDKIKEEISPSVIVPEFFQNIMHINSTSKQVETLFSMLQFIERQVVLLDALEDAAFTKTHDIDKEGTITNLIGKLSNPKKFAKAYQILQTYRMRIVLTAHPTQFYPQQVLEIIHQLTKAIKDNKLLLISELLLQLGRTPFTNQKKPTAIDEANIIIHYMKKVFYPAIKNIIYRLNTTFKPLLPDSSFLPTLIELGFWPGGDRDGNPTITAVITHEVANNLKLSILNIYIDEMNNLRRYLTFKNMWNKIDNIIRRLEATKLAVIVCTGSFDKAYKNCQEFIDELLDIKTIILTQYDGLFVEKLIKIIITVKTFGFYFASIDLRQNSKAHSYVITNIFQYVIDNHSIDNDSIRKISSYLCASNEEKISILSELLQNQSIKMNENICNLNPLIKDVIDSLAVAKEIQDENGEKGLHRYIISNTQQPYQIMEIFFFAQLAGWNIHELSLDIVPLFETIEDLQSADETMRQLFELTIYKHHLHYRENKQYIMLGFSDSTKDGGYITANWGITKAKIKLDQLAKKFGIVLVFFDGRGGSPARGGGNIYNIYRALEGYFHQNQIETTIQGQTISTDFGTIESAKYNIEHLFSQVILSRLNRKNPPLIKESDFDLLESISRLGFESYQQLKHHPMFMPYLENITPVTYYGELNIASRPPSRDHDGSLKFEDLRAIPFVGAWGQIKQHMPAYYGFGTALMTLIKEGKESELKKLYQHSLYFKTQVDNVMQALLKTNFSLTVYVGEDKVYSEIWHILRNEFNLCISTLKNISGQSKLLENYPVIYDSIMLREHVVLPLLVIQQFAMIELLRLKDSDSATSFKVRQVLRKLILKSLAANVNASRNSV